ncbi:MAG: arginine--tRNA ligase [Bacteroidetes bacterium]|nr:arginine--tRNA ligase [Rhodothermia bacterium]MCS7154245.1 arginine--tRNA ligase [Bacteroidota bacterium]MCX7906719.1 arginine--tRNA ligase [Bacteroidota bacterium]MDW8137001.1 arginine--tRNA ligase [Bacteroidota bacterium]MDW8285128.1 arginine--tRNA ligase [Bacteroidota bacterium]
MDLRPHLAAALRDAAKRAGLDGSALDAIAFQKPARPEHGDWATNLALRLAAELGLPAREIAQRLIEQVSFDPRRVSRAEVAGPGFINVFYAPSFLHDTLAEILASPDDYGRSRHAAGRRALVEFVSANPTGPLTVGHGRNAVLGDAIARLLEWNGYAVTREYYFNNAGRQMRLLGESVRARYQQLLGQDVAFPEEGYQGEYIWDIARALLAEHGDRLLAVEELEPFKEAAERIIFADILRTLARLGVQMDSFFNEHDLYKSGALKQLIERLRERELVYESEGALWFRGTSLGRHRDVVLLKSTGEPTYRLPDIAYHIHKLERGYDLIVNVFGADHIDTYPDVLAALRALGYEVERVRVLLYQFVTLLKDGQPYKMSTRRATFVTLDELIDEVGPDVTRFFFLMRSPGTHLEFDLDLAKEASEKNPVFYLQYAHARIVSIVRKAQELGLVFEEAPAYELLTHPHEVALMKALLDLPLVIQEAAEMLEPHRVIGYLNEVAAAFHRFYHSCRIIGEEPRLASARMHLAQAARVVLRNGLNVLGVSAPEHM